MDTTGPQPDKDLPTGKPNQTGAEVIGLDEEERNLLIEAAGQRFTLPVDGDLRRLIRRARSTPVEDSGENESEEIETSPGSLELTPREIQTRIRAGEAPEDIAETTETDLATIRRYEGPTIAERDYVVSQAKIAPIARDSEAPLLGEVVLDRLATRGVTAPEVEWNAHRIPGAWWTVELIFIAGERERSASWSFNPRSRLISALDDEARWLTETEEPRDEPIRSQLGPVHDLVYDVDADGGVVGAGGQPPADESATTAEPDEKLARQQDLLDELSSRRGRRQPIVGDDDDDPAEFLGEIPAAHPPASRPDLAVDAEILQLPDQQDELDSADEDLSDAQAARIAEKIGDIEAQPAARNSQSIDPTAASTTPTSRDSATRVDSGAGADSAAPSSGDATTSAAGKSAKNSQDDGAIDEEKPKRTRRSARRASVPSWDEIVFGARTD